MKFAYVRYGDFFRPIVPATLIVGDRRLSYEALVDTGADHSVVHAEVAEVLGLQPSDYPLVEVVGLAGSTQGFVADVDLQVAGATLLNVPIIFADLGPRSLGILGHANLFNRLRLTFEFAKQQFEIIPKKHRS